MGGEKVSAQSRSNAVAEKNRSRTRSPPTIKTYGKVEREWLGGGAPSPEQRDGRGGGGTGKIRAAGVRLKEDLSFSGLMIAEEWRRRVPDLHH